MLRLPTFLLIEMDHDDHTGCWALTKKLFYSEEKALIEAGRIATETHNTVDVIDLDDVVVEDRP